jgi:O-antigen/teichoic acid export membrane protein
MSVALGGGILGGGLSFLLLVVMARTVAQSDFGLLVLALNVLISTAAFAIWGVDYATIRFVAAARSTARKRGAMLTGIALVMMINLIISATAAALAGPISTDLLGQPRFTPILRTLALVLPLTVLAQMLSAALSGLEQARGEFARKVVEQSARILLAWAAYALGLGLVGVIFGFAAAAVAAVVVVGWLLLRALPLSGPTEKVPLREMLAYSWPQAVANGAAQLWTLASILILTRATDARTVALFGAAFAIAQLPLLFYYAFAYRFSPTIARLWDQGDHETLRETLKGVTRWVVTLALPLYAAVIALPGPLLRMYGPTYTGAATALVILTVATLVNSMAGPVERALIMSGRVKLEMRTNVIATIVTIALAIPITNRYGLVGAASTALVYASLRNATKSYLVWRTMGMNALSLSLARPIAAALLSSLAVVVVARQTDLGESLVGTAALGALQVLLYFVLLFRLIGIPKGDRHALAVAIRGVR